MELGDRYLVVQRAALGANPGKGPDGGMPGPPGMGGMMGMGGMGGPGDFGMSQPPASILAAGATGPGEPTKVLQILNMVAIEELLSDEDYLEIVEDIREECGKFGTVEEVKIPRPVKTSNGKVDVKASEGVKDLGKVLVLFEKEEETTKALQAIAGRQFGGASFPSSLLPLSPCPLSPSSPVSRFSTAS
jgi:splicing factor U2AF subunit